MWAKLKARLTRKLVTVTFYMKSGNVIVADRVEDRVTVTNSGDSVSRIAHWQQHKPKNRVFLNCLALSQIESIVVS